MGIRQLVMMIILVGAWWWPAPAQAHGVAVDGDAADWTGALSMSGAYDLTAGEWGWRAADPAYPLQEFRVTGDNLYLYVLVRFHAVSVARGAGAPLLQIAVDTDQRPASGQTVFAGFTATRLIDGPANWERLIRTTFGVGRDIPAILDANFTDLATREDLLILSPQRQTLEMRVRWSALGVAPPTRLRLTVALFTANPIDNVQPEGSAALAIVRPGRATRDDVERLDAYFDVEFVKSGDASPPPPPVRIWRWDVPVPLALRDPLIYGAIAGIILIILGILLRLRGRSRSWWWG